MTPQKNVFPDAQLRNEHQLLMNDVDPELVSLVRSFDFDRIALPKNLTPVSFIESGDDLHERRFARAVFADQRVTFAAAHFEAHVVKHGDSAERLGDVRHFQERLGIMHKSIQSPLRSPAPPAVQSGSSPQRSGRSAEVYGSTTALIASPTRIASSASPT